jgi:hypothetical protein
LPPDNMVAVADDGGEIECFEADLFRHTEICAQLARMENRTNGERNTTLPLFSRALTQSSILNATPEKERFFVSGPTFVGK